LLSLICHVTLATSMQLEHDAKLKMADSSNLLETETLCGSWRLFWRRTRDGGGGKCEALKIFPCVFFILWHELNRRQWQTLLEP